MNEKCHQKFRTLDLPFVQELTFFPTVAKSSHKKHFQPVMSEAAVSKCLQQFQKRPSDWKEIRIRNKFKLERNLNWKEIWKISYISLFTEPDQYNFFKSQEHFISFIR